MMPPTSIDGTDITGATIDGTDVTEITVDGDTVFTAGPTIIDNFEDGNISEYSGSTGTFTTTTSNPIEGGTSLVYPGTGSDGRQSIISTSGLDNYPSAGDTFSVKTRASTYGDNQQYICFGASSNMVPFDSGDGYFLALFYNVSLISFYRMDSGSGTQLDNDSISFTNGETYTTEIEWGSGGGFSITLSDTSGNVGSVSATDSTYTSGGFGFAAGELGANVDMLYDDAVII